MLQWTPFEQQLSLFLLLQSNGLAKYFLSNFLRKIEFRFSPTVGIICPNVLLQIGIINPVREQVSLQEILLDFRCGQNLPFK
jgi:hypothetical protein